MEELYDKLIAAYKSGDENSFIAWARNWMAYNAPNPFANDTKAHVLYFKAQQAYSIWKKKAINYRSSKVRMVKYIKQIVLLNQENPYKPERKTPEQEQIHVFGVIPEETFSPEHPNIDEQYSKEPDV